MDKLLFIINPVAGGGKSRRLVPLIKETMNENGIQYDIILTTKPKEAIGIAEEKSLSYDTIVAVGGDGTVNEVAKGLINSKRGTLGIIPGGTGNDMSKSLGISMNPKEALQSILNGYKKVIDIGNVNGHHFLNISGIGFDTDVLKRTESIKKRFKGKMAYVLGIISALIGFKIKEIYLEIDDKDYKKNAVLLAVGNGSYYGGGMKVLPMAINDDGYFHVCLVKDISNFKILFLFPLIFKGNHIKLKKYVEIYKAKKVKVVTEEDNMLNLDGELIPLGKEIDFCIDDYKLSVICNS